MKKRFVALFLICILMICVFPVSGFAAKNSDVTRVYKDVFTNTDFMQKLYVTVPKYADQGLSEELVTARIKRFIGDVIDSALYSQATGNLTSENVEGKLKEIVMLEAYNIEAEYLSLILDSLPDETISKLFEGVIPDEFRQLARILAKEAYCILGFTERTTDIIFDDMKGCEWANVAVDYLFNMDAIGGTGDFVFEPYGDVTREQFAKMLCGAFDSEIESESGKSAFADVSADAWYAPYIDKLAGAGLIKGISDNEFGTGLLIKRQDIAVLIFRMGEELGYLSQEAAKSPFNDQNDISVYAVNAVNALKNNDIIKGDENGFFNPHSTATRAEAAQMIYNFYIFASNLKQ